jgi:hypothetical protein
MPRGQGSTSWSSGTQAMVARPPFKSRKLFLETTFAVKEDFSKDDATKWAVQELKNRGLKRLLKPVASTAYERLVWSFYENLKYNCNRPDVLVSSIDDRDVEVTIADIASILKCHHEPPKADGPWIDCPSMLTIEDIVSNMCEGKYVDRHWNAIARLRFLPSFGLWTSCYIGMCVPWDTRHRGGTYFLVPYIRSIDAFGALFLRSFGGRYINSRRKCTTE